MIEQLAADADEGFAGAVFIGAWRLAHEHDPGRRIAIGEDQIGGRLLECAAIEGGQRLDKFLQARGRGGEFPGAGRGGVWAAGGRERSAGGDARVVLRACPQSRRFRRWPGPGFGGAAQRGWRGRGGSRRGIGRVGLATASSETRVAIDGHSSIGSSAPASICQASMAAGRWNRRRGGHGEFYASHPRDGVGPARTAGTRSVGGAVISGNLTLSGGSGERRSSLSGRDCGSL